MLFRFYSWTILLLYLDTFFLQIFNRFLINVTYANINNFYRTKLKQTEVDCEFLKKYCETLTDENRKLYKELQELKALKVGEPLYMKLPAVASLRVCPSCERDGSGAAQNQAKPPHLYGSFTNPSTAC